MGDSLLHDRYTSDCANLARTNRKLELLRTIADAPASGLAISRSSPDREYSPMSSSAEASDDRSRRRSGRHHRRLRLAQKLEDAAEIHLVSDSPRFSFVPSNPWVAVGWRTPGAIQVDWRRLSRKAIGFDAIRRRQELHPEKTARARRRTRPARIRLSGHRHRPRTGLRRDRGARARGAYRSRSATSTMPIERRAAFEASCANPAR